MQKLIVFVGILAVLLVACGGNDENDVVKGALREDAQSTESAQMPDENNTSSTRSNTHSFDAGFFALLENTLYLFNANGQLRAEIPDVQDVWQWNDELWLQTSEGLARLRNDDEVRLVLPLEPTQTIFTFLPAPDEQWLLIGHQTPKGAETQLPYRIESKYAPFQSYWLLDTKEDMATPLEIQDAELASYAIFQGLPFWTTDNRLLLFALLLEEDYEVNIARENPYLRTTNEAFLITPTQNEMRRLEEMNVSINTIQQLFNLRQSLIMQDANRIGEYELAPLQTDLAFGVEIIEIQEEMPFASITVIYPAPPQELCARLPLVRQPLEGVFVPQTLFQEPSAAISNLWWHDERVWFLRAYAPNCDERQIDLALMNVDLEGNLQTIYTARNTATDPYQLAFAPSADGRVLLWGSGDASTAHLMATYTTNATTEIIWQQARTGESGLRKVGWLSE
ncbi:MAG: hypothetical protein CUN55_00250 [Phototrophicales bacterium]|nr:MAG: hypothetical protein CUN55_00250 [Phototrophicales bacterium]